MANAITFTVLFLLFLSLKLPLSTPTSTTTLPLSRFISSPQQLVDNYQRITHLAAASLARAHHLKNPNSATAATTSTTPLSPRSYGGYSISLKFGTPPQTIPFVMDTGSNFVWFPCTNKYVCNNCSFSTGQKSMDRIPTFNPKLSSTAKLVGCLNPKCRWIHGPNTRSRCSDCAFGSSNCTQICPPYIIVYGSGSTGGLALLDTLSLNDHKVPDFLVGCSLFSSRQPAGIAGFGRGDAAAPSQLGLSKFSYCLLSHRFDDDARMSSSLNLTGKSIYGEKLPGVSYTPFLKNPEVQGKKSFSVYYYLGLKEIFVGGKKVKIPRQILSPPDPATGYGGTIVDSGTTFTYMGREIFEPLAREIETQVKNYKRAKQVEALTGLRPCFYVSDVETVSFPSLMFNFKGGAKMNLALENYFVFGSADALCLTIVTDPPGRETLNGPKVILGNFQQQNYYVEYDLKHNRFGFRQQKCG